MMAPCASLLFTLLLYISAVAVVGLSSRLPSNGDLILNGSKTATSGNLEVFYNDQFHSVCYSGFNKYAADTACRQLGLEPAVNFTAIDTGSTDSEGYVIIPQAAYVCASVDIDMLQ